MRHIKLSLVGVILLTIALWGCAPQEAQLDPTNQQQSIDAAVQERLNATASAEANRNATAAANADAAAFEATVNARVQESVKETEAAVWAERGLVTRNADWTPVSQTLGTIDMVQVPPGCFMMGSETGASEMPVHEQCFDALFWIGQTEVTNAQYAEFISADGYNEQRYWTDAGWAWKVEDNVTAPENYDGFTDGNQPRVGVSWYEAVAYTHWLTEQLRASGAIGQDEEIRLPTESEWEYAARGPNSLTYPWGNDFDGTRLNFCDTNCTIDWRDTSVDDGYGDVTAPVGSYPLGASWVGALDMSGNVWEWGLSGYAEYPYVGTDGRNDISGDTGRVLRGGSWNLGPNRARAAYRLNNSPDGRYDDSGFRLLRAGG